MKSIKNILIINLILLIGLVSVYGIWSGSVSHYANLSDGVTVSKWNGFLGEFASVFGWTGADMLEAQTGDVLTHTKRNSLVDKVETYTNIPNCNSDNGGNCKITQASKTLLDSDLIASNILTGKNLFGIVGTVVPTAVTDLYVTVYGSGCPTFKCKLYTDCSKFCDIDANGNGYKIDSYANGHFKCYWREYTYAGGGVNCFISN